MGTTAFTRGKVGLVAVVPKMEHFREFVTTKISNFAVVQ